MNPTKILTMLALTSCLALGQAQTTVGTNGTCAASPPPSSAEQTIKNIKNPSPWLSWGADLRVRNEYFDNALSLGVPSGTGIGFGNVHANEYMRFRARIWASLFPTNALTLNVRLAAEPREFFERATFDTFFQHQGPQWRYGIIDNLNLQWKKPVDLPATLTVGRQDIFLGDGWLVGDASPNDGSFTTFFDAARLTYKLDNAHTTVDAIGLMEFARPDAWLPTLGPSTSLIEPTVPLTTRPPGGAPITIPDPSLPLTLTDQNERGLILWVANKSLPYANLDTYFIYKHDQRLYDTPVPIFGDTGDIYTAGGRLTGLVADHWKYSAEGAYQFGRKNDPELNMPAAGVPSNPLLAPSAETTGARDLNAFGINSKLTYQFNDHWNDQISLNYEYLTGDNPSTKNDEMFDVLWGRWPMWSEMYNIYSYVQETRVGQTANLHRIGPTWTVNPMPKMEFSASYYLLLADQDVATRDFSQQPYVVPWASPFSANQALEGANVHVGDDRGQYIQTVLKYKFSQHVSGHLWGEFLFPGDFYVNHQLMEFVRAEMMFTF
jgi:hypothetical protein